MRVHGTVFVVTGSSRGIGRAIAIEAARRGAQAVVINYVVGHGEAEKTAHEVEQYGAKPLVVQADVGEWQQAKKLIDEVIKVFGRIDVLVNNAGILEPKEFKDMEPRDWQEMFRVHVFGSMNTTRAALDHMIKQRRGVIVNISSVLGLRPEPLASHYSAAKAALIAWTISLAKELAQYNIRVFAVAPGGVNTRMAYAWGPPQEWVPEEIPVKRLATPEEVAKLVLDAIENPYVTGDILTISGALL